LATTKNDLSAERTDVVYFCCKNRLIAHWRRDHPIPRKSLDSSHLRLVHSKPVKASNEAVNAWSAEDVEGEVAEWGVEYEVDRDGDLMQEIVLEWLLPMTQLSQERAQLVALGLMEPGPLLEYVTVLPSAIHRFWPAPKKG
jgi:hypothetical protein